MSGLIDPGKSAKIDVFRLVRHRSFASVHGVSVVDLWSVLENDRLKTDQIGKSESPPRATERLIGSIRRERLDHVVVFGDRHLRHVLLCYMEYCNVGRRHLSLGKDTPSTRAVQAVGRIQAQSVLGGLHHQYARI